MKKLLFTAVATTALALSGCNDFETSDNGYLDGFWQLTDVDTLANGRSGHVADRMIFWSVQANLLELSNRPLNEEVKNPSIFFRFEHKGNELALLGEPKPRVNNRVKGDSEVATPQQCGFYGLSDEGETLQVLSLENRKMILQSENYRMYFRKY